MYHDLKRLKYVKGVAGRASLEFVDARYGARRISLYLIFLGWFEVKLHIGLGQELLCLC